MISGTLAWLSISQNALNQAKGEGKGTIVHLLKLEKDANGVETEIVVPDAEFYLYKVAKPDDIQIGGRYVTNEDGKIEVTLKPGDYYFLETNPSPGYTFDQDKDGEAIKRYPFTVTESNAEDAVVTAYNRKLSGDLMIEKIVENSDDSPLPGEQLDTEFEFTVTFSDGGTYPYLIDGGEELELASSGTIKLKHGQTAVFKNLPFGVTYTVVETPTAGYVISGDNHAGTITSEGVLVTFVNTFQVRKEETGSLVITKEVRNEDGTELTDEQKEKEFDFTVTFSDDGTYEYTIDDDEAVYTIVSGETIKLKAGQKATIVDIPVGVTYTVVESDYEADGYIATVLDYEGMITVDGAVITLPFVNIFLAEKEEREDGSLLITKQVIAGDGEEIDLDSEFEFTVTFEDSGTYSYHIDDGEEIELESGGTIVLKHGQIAVFENLPHGLGFMIVEAEKDGYAAAIIEVSGTIVGDEIIVVNFVNYKDSVIPPDPEETAIIIEKIGEGVGFDLNKEFEFTVIINGEALPEKIKLKAGEKSDPIQLNVGDTYQVIEDDYTADGYVQTTLVNGTGTATIETITVAQTNRYIDRVMVQIAGEKTWDLKGEKLDLPEVITIYLKNGDTVVEIATVKPDANGKWLYTFDVPKYDSDGKEIVYTIEEEPIEQFRPEYSGMNVRNVYITPAVIVPPIVEKMIKGDKPDKAEVFQFRLTAQNGAPMPVGTTSGNKVITITGEGQLSFGDIIYKKAGTYAYTITEMNTGANDYTYDNSVYTWTVVVAEENGAMVVKSATLTKDDKEQDKVIFTNNYKKPTDPPDPPGPTDPPKPPKPNDKKITISGAKTWNHGNLDSQFHPGAIIILVKANGETIIQREISDRDHWSWTFVLNKYDADGKEIAYTIDEERVAFYDKEVKGYNITNTYNANRDPNAGGSDKGGVPKQPETGDQGNTWLWLTMMILSSIALGITVFYNRRLSKKL